MSVAFYVLPKGTDSILIDKHAYMGYALTFFALAVISFLSVSLPDPETTHMVLAEGGPVETASAVGYLLCVIYMFYRGGKAYWVRFHYIVLMALVFMCRELDFDKRFTTMGVFKSKFFFSDLVSPVEKFFGGLAVLLVLYIIFSLIFRDGRRWLKNLFKLDATSVGAFLTLCLLVSAKTLDGLGRKLEDLGVVLSERASLFALTGEEVLEMGIPIMILLAFNAYMKKQEAQATGSAATALPEQG